MNYIILIPTKEKGISVVKKIIKFGNESQKADSKSSFFQSGKVWDAYEEETAFGLTKNDLVYCRLEFFKNNSNYNDYTYISAKEFLFNRKYLIYAD